MYQPTLDEVKKMAGQGNLVPVYREIVADLETPVSAFLKINRGGPSFLLESRGRSAAGPLQLHRHRALPAIGDSCRR
jgi:hypothetical protein